MTLDQLNQPAIEFVPDVITHQRRERRLWDLDANIQLAPKA